jgi:hypothetical protein
MDKQPKKPRTEFTATVYVYVKPVNDKFARTYGKKKYGSKSAYINSLIERDRVRVA